MATRTKVKPKSSTRPTLITPAIAMDWLDTMITNRRLSQPVIDAISRDIKAGKWRVNGDPIRFDTKGRLIDGQHRLWACVEANKPIESYVVTDIHHSAMPTIDCGKRRSFANHLEISGHSRYSTCVAAMARLLWLETLDTVDSLEAGRQVPTQQELMAICRANPDMVDSADRMMMSPFLCSHSTIAFAHFKMSKIHKTQADKWAVQVTTGENIPKSHPVLKLRARFIAVRNSSRRRIPRQEILALCYKSWNAIRNGNSIKNLRWAANEAMPELI